MTNNIKFFAGKVYDKAGTERPVLSLCDIDIKVIAKDKLPWLQVFDCGYRVAHENIKWCYWNGCVFVDIDSKHYYNECKRFNPDVLENALYEYLCENYSNNFYNIQRSNSGTSYHIMFYFNVDKTETNFNKCTKYAREICETAFIELGIGYIWRFPKVNDKCSISPYQGMYLTSQTIRYNDKVNGYWMLIDEYDYTPHKIISIDKVKENAVDFINFSLDQQGVKCKYYEHISRLKIYTALVACYGTKEKTDAAWVNNIVPYLAEGNGHKRIFYMIEPDKNGWFEKYDSTYVNEEWLEPFGYSFKSRFIPKRMDDLYNEDYKVILGENERLSDVDIPFSVDKINHIYAGCGVGKTFAARKYGKDIEFKDEVDWLLNPEFKKRVCFISPLKSISKNSFEKYKDEWDIIDSDHKDEKTVKEAIFGNKNICTTWESFVLYEMYNVEFDYVIVDEIHTLYMYDYRVNSISKLKEYLPVAKGIKIIMTGTPSYELIDFDCYKIKVEKAQNTVKCDVVLYNDSYLGYLIEDIKSWTIDKNHLALIFYDKSNYEWEDKFAMYGLSVEVFCTKNKDVTDYILENENVREQITAFSVYGQAGINLILDEDKKARVYILNNSGLGIIQYANRIRNKETIDKVVIPFRSDNISNDVFNVNKEIDVEDAKRRLNVLIKTKKQYEIFSTQNNSFLNLRYGFNNDCVDWSMNELKVQQYSCYKLIKNVEEYEKQLQVIYNRLVDGYFDVNFVELTEDVKFSGDTKAKSSQFNGQMIRFNTDMIKEKNDRIWIEPTPEFNKVMTGDSEKNINILLNNLYIECDKNVQKMREAFEGYIRNIIKENGSIKKSDISNTNLYYELKNNWNTYYNNQFITVMLDEKWDNVQLTSVYMRTIYHSDMLEEDWKKLSDEAYNKISTIRKVVQNNENIFRTLESNYPSENIKFKNDEVMGKIYSYLKSKHTRGKQNTKIITVKGITFKSVSEAAKYFNVSRMTINRWIKE